MTCKKDAVLQAGVLTQRQQYIHRLEEEILRKTSGEYLEI